MRRSVSPTSTAIIAIPAKRKVNVPGSGVETGGTTGVFGLFGWTPGGSSGGKIAWGGVFAPLVVNPGGRAGSALAGAPGEKPSPSPGRNSAIKGGTKFGVLNSSLVGSDTETGFAAMAERRFPQRTRARFSPSEIKVSPAGITMRFLVQ